MAEPNFTLSNAAFALSPMVLRATTDPGTSMTLSVSDYNNKTVQVTLTADVNGEVVYDVAPIVRSFISAQFLRGNIKAGEISPYGAYIKIRLTNAYAIQEKILWARAEPALVKANVTLYGDLYTVWLLPTGKYVYRKGAPQGMITTVSEDWDETLYAKNKRTGEVAVLDEDFFPFDQVVNHSDSMFSNLQAGEYHVYMYGEENGGFDLVVEDCFPTEALKDGSQVYVRYCNQWGGISYALLQSTQRNTKNKNTYEQKDYALDDAGDGNYYHVAPDRVMTKQEITTTFKAGKDKLTREELRELQAILVSPMVDRYDAETDEWVPVYPSDSNVTETNDALHEITIEFEVNTEGF